MTPLEPRPLPADADAALAEGVARPMGRERAMPRGPDDAAARWWTPRRRNVATGVGIVLAFWWLVTGLIVALQRNALTRTVAWLGVTVLAMYALQLIWVWRHEATAAATRKSFLAGAVVWTWVCMGLYGGWIVGPGSPAARNDGPTIALAIDALASLAWHEGLCLVMLGGLWWMLRGAANRTAFWTLLTFWGVHEIAKLDIFLGVANPGARFLPQHMQFLLSYYGPAANSFMLPVTTGLAAIGAVLLFFRAWLHAREPMVRQQALLLGVVVVLAAVEYALLGVRTDAPLWDLFLEWRGY
jgi:putative photosynthetic complex assembly protein 2